MIKKLIIGSTPLEMTIALLEDGEVVEVFIERKKTRGILGNIYKGRVTKVVPGMQAAFVDIGLGRSAFLFVSDFLEEQYPDVETGLESPGDADRVAAEGRGDPLRTAGGRGRPQRDLRGGIDPGFDSPGANRSRSRYRVRIASPWAGTLRAGLPPSFPSG